MLVVTDCLLTLYICNNTFSLGTTFRQQVLLLLSSTNQESVVQSESLSTPLCATLLGFVPCLKPVLNWANVCLPEHTLDTLTNYGLFLN